MFRIRDLVKFVWESQELYRVSKYPCKIFNGSGFVNDYNHIGVTPLDNEWYPGEIIVPINAITNHMVVKNIKKHRLI